jgi:hypothetical protein
MHEMPRRDRSGKAAAFVIKITAARIFKIVPCRGGIFYTADVNFAAFRAF